MINWKRVHELRDEIGSDEFAEVVDLFIEEVDEEIDRLKWRSGMSDLDGRLHCLKGSALNLGFSELCTLCQEGEAAVAQGEADRVDINAIVSCYDRSRAAFLAGLGDREEG